MYLLFFISLLYTSIRYNKSRTSYVVEKDVYFFCSRVFFNAQYLLLSRYVFGVTLYTCILIYTYIYT